MSPLWLLFLVIPVMQVLVAAVRIREADSSVELFRGYLLAVGALVLSVVYAIGGVWPPIIQTTDVGKWLILSGTIGTTAGMVSLGYSRNDRYTIGLFSLSLMIVAIGATTNAATFLAASP